MSAHDRTTTAGGGELAVRLAPRHPRGEAVQIQTTAAGGGELAVRLAQRRPRTAAINKNSDVFNASLKNQLL